MPLKKSQGNMYDWVDFMHTHLGGECPHKCSYCYVGRNRFGRPARYTGKVHLITKELDVDYKVGRTIFIEHMNDMFAEGVKDEWIRDILCHCNKYRNIYVFQTKNPKRATEFISYFPMKYLIGTTIETNRDVEDSEAPSPLERYKGIKKFKECADIFITIEPIMDLDVDIMIKWIKEIQPKFINIGADSKRSRLMEPSVEKVKALIAGLQKITTIKKKNNLTRLMEEK